jgi:hypothetical protein
MSDLVTKATAQLDGNEIDKEIDAFIKDNGITQEMIDAPIIEKRKEWEQKRLESLRKSLDGQKLQQNITEGVVKTADVGAGLSFCTWFCSTRKYILFNKPTTNRKPYRNIYHWSYAIYWCNTSPCNVFFYCWCIYRIVILQKQPVEKILWIYWYNYCYNITYSI